ncbi:hypothetical protein [Glutamicibacter soli]|uniref:hypothetical protein n=1 Tax=Glutamicibacter soli TaxID=453836 RepID=UPI003FD49AE7
MSDYTPTTEQVRHAYLDHMEFAAHVRGVDSYDKESGDAFDRWLASVKAQTITDVADQMRDKFTAAWLRGKAREYTHGPRKIVGAFAISESNQEADCGDTDL